MSVSRTILLLVVWHLLCLASALLYAGLHVNQLVADVTALLMGGPQSNFDTYYSTVGLAGLLLATTPATFITLRLCESSLRRNRRTRCSNCRQVLHNLVRPECPACGEEL